MAKKRTTPGHKQTVLTSADAKRAASAKPSAGDDAMTPATREKAGRPLIKNRVRELREMPAKDLRANAKNWREHPQHQREALAGVLQDVGFADVVIARELKNGELEIIDGHLRAELADDQLVPVVIVDVSSAEADKLLATMDPIAALASTNRAKLGSLLGSLKTKSTGVQGLLDKLKKQADVGQAKERDDAPATKPAAKAEHTVIVIGSSRDEQDTLFTELAEAGYTVKMGPQKRDPRKTAQRKGK